MTGSATTPGTTRTERLQRLLTDAFAPTRLEVVDDSARHAGHAGARGLAGGETHFNVLVVSDRFAGLNRVARSRAVHAVLETELAGGLHALGLTLKAPGEP